MYTCNDEVISISSTKLHHQSNARESSEYSGVYPSGTLENMILRNIIFFFGFTMISESMII